MSNPNGVVYLLDDEPGMVKAVTRLLRANGFEVRGFTTPASFLEAFRPGSDSCLILDVAMPDLDGLHLQRRLTHEGILLPIVFLTGHGDIPMTGEKDDWEKDTLMCKPSLKMEAIQIGHGHIQNQATIRA